VTRKLWWYRRRHEPGADETRPEHGQTLVEFALVLPVLLLLIFGLVDFGRAFQSWLVVTNAAREGARVGATQQPLSAIQLRVTEAAASIDTSSAVFHIAVDNAQGPRGSAVVVDVTYDFQYVTPIGDLMNLISGGSLATPTITGQSSMRLE
jgi:Flp pilus assembly protein TadG